MSLFGPENPELVEHFDSEKLAEEYTIKTERKLSEIKKRFEKPPVWSEYKTYKYIPKQMQSHINQAVGTYCIKYKPTDEVMYVGHGNINQRLDRHYKVFMNGGEAVVNNGGTSDGSAVAGKMFKHDPNFDNWLFTWCHFGFRNKGDEERLIGKAMGGEYEERLVQSLRPPFNKSFMSGK